MLKAGKGSSTSETTNFESNTNTSSSSSTDSAPTTLSAIRFCQQNNIYLCHDFNLAQEWIEILKQFDKATMDAGDVMGHSLLQIPGLTVSDLVFVFNQKISGNHYELAAGKSKNVLFLAAYLLDVRSMNILLKEFTDKQRQIPALEEELRRGFSSSPNNPSSPTEIRLKIEKCKAVAPDLTARDPFGRHIVHFAARGGDPEMLAFLLESKGVIESLTSDDKELLMVCAVASGSVRCVQYVRGTFKTLPPEHYYRKVGPYFGKFDFAETRELENTPVLTRADIEAKFATQDDGALFDFINEHTKFYNTKNYGILLAYYYLGGKPEKCKEMLQRVRELELSPIMRDGKHDMDILIKVQNEFARATWNERAFEKQNLHQLPHYHAMRVEDANKAYLAAVERGDVGECHSLRRRYPINTSLYDSVQMAVRFGQKQLAGYFVEEFKPLIPMGFRDADACFLHEAIKKRDLDMLRTLIEDHGMPANLKDTLAQALSIPDPVLINVIGNEMECASYLLNRVDFLHQDKLTLQWDLDLSDVAKTQIASKFRGFSQKAVETLFAKPADELYGYLRFMSKLRIGYNFYSFCPTKLSNTTRLLVMKRLLALEREALARNECVDFLINCQIEFAEKLTCSDAELAEYKTELDKHYAACVAIIENPFSNEVQREACLQILEKSQSYSKGRMGIKAPLQKAHQVEVTRLVHLVKQNQGDVADHRRRLKLIAKTGNPQAQGFIDECNNELAITLAQTSGFVAEEKLREMAKTQLFAQLQLAGRLIAEHESRKLKIFNRAAAKEAYVMIADPCLDHFPEVNYYRGRCLQEGIGCDVSKERALYYYFQSAKNNCDLAKKILKEWSVSSAKNSDLPCIADIYQRIIGDLANPNGHYTGFSPVVEKYPAIFVKCMLSVAEQFDAPAARIMLWQNALQLAPTAKEKSIIEQCMQTFFMRLNQNSEKEIYEFSQAISALSPEQCANFALKFVNDQKLSEQIRSLWIVAAEAKWVSTYGNTASTALSQLQKYLAHINESDQQSMRTSLQVGTLLSEQKTKMVEEIHEEKPVAVVSDDKSLQKRVDVCGYTGKIDELLLDPIAFTLMSNPGVCEDERIYDRSTFDSLQGKRSPFNPNVTILTFTPVQAIRSKALEFVEGLERAQKNAASASTSSSSSTASISAAVQLTFFAPPQPTAPTAETVVVPVASAPDFNNNDDDDGEAITYPVASKDEPVAFPAIPGQGPTVRSAQYS